MTLAINETLAVTLRIKQKARDLGFNLVGVCAAAPSSRRDFLRDWLDQGRAGSMEFLKKRFDERTDVSTYFPGCRSIVCVAINYFAGEKEVALPGADGAACGDDDGRIARYALGDDYHEWIKTRLFHLADFIRTESPEAETRVGVDTAPIMEKELSARAGIGWQGKNTCILNERIGSWLFLGEVLTTIDLAYDEPAIDRCGTCTRCIDACPTQAITPYQLDASKCISYLTIEHRGEIAPELKPKIGDWLYGCDICQDVCPWNSKAPASSEPAVQTRFENASLDAREILNWLPSEYQSRLKGSAMKRVKLPMLQRNAAIVLENKRGK